MRSPYCEKNFVGDDPAENFVHEIFLLCKNDACKFSPLSFKAVKVTPKIFQIDVSQISFDGSRKKPNHATTRSVYAIFNLYASATPACRGA